MSVAVAGALIVVGASCGGDDDESSTSQPPPKTSQAAITASPPTTEEVTTTAAPPTTEEAATTTALPPPTTEAVTTTLPTPDPVVVEASALATPLVDFWNGEGAEAPPFDDGEIEAHWYSWDGRYLVVYAGYDPAAATAQCVGGQHNDADQVLSTNYRQPTSSGGCDPEDWFTTGFNPAVIVSSGDDVGLRVCGRLVMFHTDVPLVVDGNPQPGQLLGSVARFSELNDGIVGVGNSTTIDNDLITELDPTAIAYELPDGWLSDGMTTVTC